MADNPNLFAVATSLDAAGVYSARLLTPVSEVACAGGADVPVPAAAGVGFVENGGPVAVLTFAHHIDDEAAAHLTGLREITGDSGSWSGRVTVESAVTSGRVAEIRLRSVDHPAGLQLWKVLESGDVLGTSCGEGT